MTTAPTAPIPPAARTAARAIPGPRLAPAMLLALRRDPLTALTRLAREYGDVAGIPLGRRPLVLLSHPDDIRDVLVVNHQRFHKPEIGRDLPGSKSLLGNGLLRSEGEFHRRQRRMIQPAFHRQRIAGYAATMSRYAQETCDRWRDGDTLDMDAEMMRLTLAIVGKTLFDTDVERDEAAGVRAALTTAMRLGTQARFAPLAGLRARLPLPSNTRLREARAQLDATIYRIIAERRASGEDRGDLLSMLLLAQDDEGDGTGMSDEQLRDEAMTLFLAGHETTSNALSWTWMLLAQHPNVEARLHAELDDVLAGRAPTADDVPRLRYTEMVLTEAMRLYPPAWTIARRALDGYPVRDYVVPAGSLVVMSQYVVHRDPRWYPDPARFDPDRWTPEARAERPKFAYFPFGGGPRLCIGEPFAWMEGVLILATLAARWQARLVSGQRVAPEPLVTLRPRTALRMTLERRDG